MLAILFSEDKIYPCHFAFRPDATFFMSGPKKNNLTTNNGISPGSGGNGVTNKHQKGVALLGS